MTNKDVLNLIWGKAFLSHASQTVIGQRGDFRPIGDKTLKLQNPFGVQNRMTDLFADRHLTLLGNHDVRGANASQWIRRNALATLAFSLPRDLIRAWFAERHGSEVDDIEWNRVPSEVRFGCSHWPVPIARLPGPEWINLHGHIHGDPSLPLHVNCSVEVIDYAPKRIEDLVTPSVIRDLIRRQDGAFRDLELLTSVRDRVQ